MFLNQLKEGLLLIDNNQILHLRVKPNHSKIWRVVRVGRFLLIRAQAIAFKAEANEYADNVETKELEFEGRRRR